MSEPAGERSKIVVQLIVAALSNSQLVLSSSNHAAAAKELGETFSTLYHAVRQVEKSL